MIFPKHSRDDERYENKKGLKNTRPVCGYRRQKVQRYQNMHITVDMQLLEQCKVFAVSKDDMIKKSQRNGEGRSEENFKNALDELK